MSVHRSADKGRSNNRRPTLLPGINVGTKDVPRVRGLPNA